MGQNSEVTYEGTNSQVGPIVEISIPRRPTEGPQGNDYQTYESQPGDVQDSYSYQNADGSAYDSYGDGSS